MAGITHAFAGVALAAAMTVVLAGCSTTSGDEESSGPSLPSLTDLNPFNVAKTPLPGQRMEVLTTEDQVNGRIEATAGAITIPPPMQMAEWATPGGTPSNAPGHLALAGSMRTLWTASVGTGSSYASKLTAPPIVHQGRVYVMDAAAQVSAYAVAGGARVWATKASPDGASDTKAFGGGIAAESGRVFAVTGFGTALAFDAASGAKLWEVKLGAPFHNAPTVAEGRLFATNIDGQVICLSTSDGSTLWTYHGVPQQAAALLTSTRPAVTGDLVIVPFTSGDLAALKVDSGAQVWIDSLNGARSTSSIAALTDPSSPVAAGDSVYAVSRSGRMIASNQAKGTRTWAMNLNGVETPCVAGDAIYVVDLTGRLVAINRADGQVRWAAKLPGNAKVWSGPVLAGGKLWLTSSKGLLAAVDPGTGQTTAQRDLGQPIYIAPVVADAKMFVLTDKANLLAIE